MNFTFIDIEFDIYGVVGLSHAARHNDIWLAVAHNGGRILSALRQNDQPRACMRYGCSAAQAYDFVALVFVFPHTDDDKN